MTVAHALHLLFVLLMPPLLFGVISRTKASFAGRQGASCLQPYFDLWRLLRKRALVSSSATHLYRTGPVVSLAALLVASVVVPVGGGVAPLSFSGDMILFAYLLALGRFLTVAAALDTGSSFEGMGGARDASFACLAEPALFLAFAALARMSGSLSLSGMVNHPLGFAWFSSGGALLLLTAGLFIVLLAENCRIPFDDPNTHLELTMIHEVMVLDHSGRAFGAITYAASLKLFLLGTIFVRVALPLEAPEGPFRWLFFFLSMVLLGIAIGIVESVMARLRLVKVPQMLGGAIVLTAFSLLLVMR